MELIEDLLGGEKVRLTAFRREDVTTMLAWDADTAYRRMMDSDMPPQHSEEQVWKGIEADMGSDKVVGFAVRPVDAEKIVGHVGFDEIDWQHRCSSLGIGIGETASRRKGYGEEVLRLLVAYGFRELNLHRIELTVFDYNEPAIALYERVGVHSRGNESRSAETRRGLVWHALVCHA